MTIYFIHRTDTNKIVKEGFKMIHKAKEFKRKLEFLYPLQEFGIGKIEKGIKTFNINCQRKHFHKP